MHRIVVEGGVPLSGRLRAEGSKNASLPILAATLLVEDASTIRRVPRLEDVRIMLRLIQSLGARVQQMGDEVTVDASGPLSVEPPDLLVRKMRASFLVLGPLAARRGRACITLPGGCAIGKRPVDLHLMGLQQLGARIEVHGRVVRLWADGLRGARIDLPVPSVTATENLMMAATLARGETLIENAAREPEVVDLARCLTGMGAQIEGIGTSRLRIRGGGLRRGARHAVIPDRIEAGTYLIAAAATGGDVTVEGVQPDVLRAMKEKLRNAGAVVTEGKDWIRCRMKDRPLPTVVRTRPYPGFPTDLQPPLAAMLMRCRGVSLLTETIFENRFLYATELARMGARIHVVGRTAVIRGVPQLQPATIRATDLRAAAALLIAALMTPGRTWIGDMQHLERGYVDAPGKLAALGARLSPIRAGGCPAASTLLPSSGPSQS